MDYLLDLEEQRRKRLSWRYDPIAYVRDKFGVTLWQELGDVATSVNINEETVVISANTIGKTQVAAWLTSWWLECHDDDALVLTISTSHQQLKDALAPRIRSVIASNPYFSPWLYKLNDMDFRLSEKRMWIAQAPKEPENVAGKHARYVLQIIEEASGLRSDIAEAIQGNHSGERPRKLFIGNPLYAYGELYDRFNASPANARFQISAFQHPNVITGEDIIPQATNRKKIISDLKEFKCMPAEPNTVGAIHIPWASDFQDDDGNPLPEWWKPTNKFLSRDLAEFPEGSSESMYSRFLLKQAMARVLPADHLTPTALGCDPARSEEADADETVIVLGNEYGMTHIESHRGWSTDQTGDRIVALARAYKLKRVAIDATGLGVGVSDYVSRKGVKCLAINFTEKATKEDRFSNIKAEMYGHFRDSIYSKDGYYVLLDDDLLLRQLTEIRSQEDSRARTRIEPKDKYRERTGMSPDRAEAVILMHHAARLAKGSGNQLSTYIAKEASGRGGGFDPYGGEGVVSDRRQYYEDLFS